MAENSKIEWTDHTFNPWIGCTKVSPGCDHCYAERVGARMLVQWGARSPRKRTSESNWREPLRWNERARRDGVRYRVFCASLADVFDNEVLDLWRTDLFRLIARTPHLDWLILTKRIGNSASMIRLALNDLIREESDPPYWPWLNAWIGATIVNQDEADRDIPKLFATPAAKRFLSIEPVLGQIDLSRWLVRCDYGSLPGPSGIGGVMCDRCHRSDNGCERIDWVIVGGESGPKARPADIGHIRSIVRQCQTAGVPVFVKQLGARPEWNDQEPDLISEPPYWMPLKLHDRKGGDPGEWPRSVRVREFPR